MNPSTWTWDAGPQVALAAVPDASPVFSMSSALLTGGVWLSLCTTGRGPWLPGWRCSVRGEWVPGHSPVKLRSESGSGVLWSTVGHTPTSLRGLPAPRPRSARPIAERGSSDAAEVTARPPHLRILGSAVQLVSACAGRSPPWALWRAGLEPVTAGAGVTEWPRGCQGFTSILPASLRHGPGFRAEWSHCQTWGTVPVPRPGWPPAGRRVAERGLCGVVGAAVR